MRLNFLSACCISSFFFRSVHVQLVGVYAGALDGVTFVTKRNSAALKKKRMQKIVYMYRKTRVTGE